MSPPLHRDSQDIHREDDSPRNLGIGCGELQRVATQVSRCGFIRRWLSLPTLLLGRIYVRRPRPKGTSRQGHPLPDCPKQAKSIHLRKCERFVEL